MNKDFVSREKLDEVVAQLAHKMHHHWDQYVNVGYGGDEDASDAYEDAMNMLLEAMNDNT